MLTSDPKSGHRQDWLEIGRYMPQTSWVVGLGRIISKEQTSFKIQELIWYSLTFLIGSNLTFVNWQDCPQVGRHPPQKLWVSGWAVGKVDERADGRVAGSGAGWGAWEGAGKVAWLGALGVLIFGSTYDSNFNAARMDSNNSQLLGRLLGRLLDGC